jgi:hypothetical protein
MAVVRGVVRAGVALLLVWGAAPGASAQGSPASEPAAAPAPASPSGPTGATGATGPAAAAPDPDAIVGGVTSLPYNRSASWGARRVVGPAINLTQDGPAEWKGNIRDFDGVIAVSESRISAAGLNIVVEWEKDGFEAQGTWDGKRVRIVFTPAKLVVRIDNRFQEMERVEPDLFATVPQGPAVRVTGNAASPKPMYPQMILALLAVF